TTIAISGMVLLYIEMLQCDMIYPSNWPNGSRRFIQKPSEYGIPYSEVTMVTEDSIRLRAFICKRPIDREARKRPTILMFHGHRLPIAERFYNEFKCNVKQSIIKVYGQSLGGAVAIDLVSKNESKVNALIIENTFLSIPKLVPHILPILRYLTFMCSQIWPSEKSIKKIKFIPILFLSGTRDEVIPQQQMKKLFELSQTSGGKEWKEFLYGSHNETIFQPGYFQFVGGTIVVSSGIAILYSVQRNSIYTSNYPEGSRKHVPKPSEYGIPYSPVILTTKDNVNIRAYVCKRHTEDEASSRPTVLMFHGNGGNMGHRLPIAERFFKDFKCNVVMVSYRGYGRSEGTPTEKGLCLDAQAALQYIKQDEILRHTKLIVYGQSLGGAVAINLVARNERCVNILILENTFLNIQKVLPKLFPNFNFLSSDIWPSEQMIKKIKTIPILFLSGKKDEIIPPFHMQKLFELSQTSGGKELIEFNEGSHLDTVQQPNYFRNNSMTVRLDVWSSDDIDDSRNRFIGNSFSEMDNLKRRHNTTAQTQEYEPVPFEPDLNYVKTQKPPRLPSTKLEELRAIYNDYYDIIHPLFFTVLSFWTRFYLISLSDIVLWDEAHFGKFASHYLKQEFYFDVHPPLGKMIVALAGLLVGYDGSFDFASGSKYPENLNYVLMRIFLASFGAWMVPLAYFTAIELDFSQHAVILVALMVLLGKSFSIDWWLWLALTGISIGCVTSVKWVGLFVTALVGLYTIEDLWDKFGDLNMPKLLYLQHWIARIICLIILPILIYMLSFVIHFAILTNSGPGDAQMSSLFQAGLYGNNFAENPLELAYGSRVTIKNMGFGGGLLHSHVQAYPVGSEQQQVTCYHHHDVNNDWFIKKTREAPISNNENEVEFVHDKDMIILFHAQTGRNLHSHQVAAPVTKSQWEVSCYGNETIGDLNDYWVVEVVDDMYTKTDRIRSLTTRMRFRHKHLGCYLRAANAALPQWGFKQIEVTCDKQNNPRDFHTYWNIERHWNDLLPSGGRAYYKSSFLNDFWHLNVAMYTTNNALVPDPDKEDILASTPGQWPFLKVGLRMCSWADDVVKYYLLGNPVVWWSGTVSLIIFVVTLLWYLVRRQRGYKDFSPAQWTHFLYVGKVCGIGWLLHYLPFWIMGRVTYLHHYFPALYFSILMAAFMTDHLTNIAFGIDYPSSEFEGRKWVKTWNIVD
ncbi:8797_t:CDS:10, partial [Funneliformis geosporum]